MCMCMCVCIPNPGRDGGGLVGRGGGGGGEGYLSFLYPHPLSLLGGPKTIHKVGKHWRARVLIYLNPKSRIFP